MGTLGDKLLRAIVQEGLPGRNELSGLGADRWSWLSPSSGHARGLPPRLQDQKSRISFILVEPGTFLMGSPESECDRRSDEHQHLVTMPSPFLLADTLVTQGQWRRVMAQESRSNFSTSDDSPVDSVSWNDSLEFCEAAGGGYRLPTEAEWEYACRAGTGTPFAFGGSLSTDQANFDGEEYSFKNTRGDIQPTLLRVGNGICRWTTTAVRFFAPNSWGFYDMHGNLDEWCSDWYDAGYYLQGQSVNPRGPSTGSGRVLRGGCWIDGPPGCRSACRGDLPATDRHDFVGFRVAVSL